MSLRDVDLNLLVILDVLLDEVHVSRAAARLSLSQPATSAALSRCRAVFNDVLLDRRDSVMILSPRAEALRQPLKAFLAEATAVVDPTPMRLVEVRQAVRIMTADHMATLIGLALHPRLVAEAPGLDLIFQPWDGVPAAFDNMAKGTTDLAISIIPNAPPDYRRQELLREKWVVVMRRDHPVADQFDLDGWLAYPHILMSGRGDRRGVLDERLETIGRVRQVGMVIPNFLIAPRLLANSDLIAMAPSRCFPDALAEPFRIFEPPIEVPDFSLHMAWHARRDGDLALDYLVRTLTELAL